MVNREVNPGRENSSSANVLGHYRSENDICKPPNHESLFPATMQYKNRFPAMEKIRKLQKNVKENAKLAPTV